jgi:hypothetical protein
MLTNGAFGQHERKPACSQCGGSGFVYLWSIARMTGRVWYCDRSTCKRFWSDARSSTPMVGNDAVVVHELQTLVSSADERELQPVLAVF